MSWCGIHGHDGVVANFRQSIRQNRLASTFLFIGPSGIGKQMFALKMAQALQCEKNSDLEFEPCQVCSPCQQIIAETHPDVQFVGKPDDRSFIPISTFIGDKEHRNREGLCRWIGLKPSYGRRKIAVINDADYLNQEGANSLLKTLEEPPPRSLLILIGTSQQRQLPTIRSRCQIVRFQALDESFVAQHLQTMGVARDEAHGIELAGLSNGSFDRAMLWASDEWTGFRSELWQTLGQGNIDSFQLAKRITAFVDAAGKDAPSRRARLKVVIEMFLTFLRELMLARSGTSGHSDAELRTAVESAAGSWSVGPETIASRIDRCIEADQQVSANANIATLVECWIDDLFAQPVLDR